VYQPADANAPKPDPSQRAHSNDMVTSANPRFDELKTTGKLPSPSGVALAIIDLCRRDGVSIDEIARAVRADPALSGRIIKFANAAANGPRRPVVSVPEAIKMVGVGTVRQLVLGFSLLGQYRSGACKAFDYSAYWSRSLAVAIASSAVCARVRSTSPDEAFTCGLLSGVGTLALATIYPTEYAELIAAPAGSLSEIARLEQERFATDHNELGAALLEDWHLPRLFVVAVFHHEAPDQSRLPDGSREFVICNLLHLASRLGDFCVAQEAARRALVPELILAAAKVGLDQASLSKMSDEVVAQWREWGKILEVGTAEVPAFAALAREKDEAPPALEPGVAGAKPQSPLNLLVVEDDRATLLLVEHVLKGLGHTVHCAPDGNAGLALAMSVRPQIIVSDWIMPGLDGVSFCKALRQTEEGQQMYFIILSALEQDDQLVEAFESGVDDYLTKPFTPRVLAARLRAGQRVIKLQEDARRDSENLRRFAAELAVANRRLQQAALTDPLTGLPNRRYGMERLEQEWAASSRSQRPLSCMVVDVDQFKQVNDTYGHDSGDVVLRQVAAVLRREMRTEDVICRLGGEEFLVISPDTALAAAMSLAERLRAAVCKVRSSSANITHNTTVSIGVAQREPAMVRVDELIKAADNALYDAKRAGRNRVASGTRAETAKAEAG
jgi:diguanylate cyclase (GGDEF)-like protein